MPRKNAFPANVREEADMIMRAWEYVPDEEFGRISKHAFLTRIQEYDNVVYKIRQLRDQLKGMLSTRKDVGELLWEDSKMVRDSVAGTYSRDSVEYERFGGTRMSDRRTPGKKSDDKKTAKTSDKTADKTTDKAAEQPAEKAADTSNGTATTTDSSNNSDSK